MYSICFDCQNARADRCRKIFDGTPVEGWTASEGMFGGFNVRACPNFLADTKRSTDRMTGNEIAQVLKCSRRTVERKSDEDIIKGLIKRGYDVYVKHSISGKRLFYLRGEIKRGDK